MVENAVRFRTINPNLLNLMDRSRLPSQRILGLITHSSHDADSAPDAVLLISVETVYQRDVVPDFWRICGIMRSEPFMERLSFQPIGAESGRLCAALERFNLHTHIKLIFGFPSRHIGVCDRNAQIIRNLIFETLDVFVFSMGTKIMMSRIVFSAPYFLTTSTAAIADE